MCWLMYVFKTPATTHIGPMIQYVIENSFICNVMVILRSVSNWADFIELILKTKA